MVMGRDSCSEGRGFESQYTGWTFFHIVKIVMFEKTKINQKEAGDGPFLQQNFDLLN